jgi:hypothetical protein
MDATTVDPMRWADAFLAALRGGGYILVGLLALLIVCRWPPWRRASKKEVD